MLYLGCAHGLSIESSESSLRITAELDLTQLTVEASDVNQK